MILQCKGEIHAGNAHLVGYCQIIAEATDLEEKQKSPRMSDPYRIKSQGLCSCTGFSQHLASSLHSRFILAAVWGPSHISAINCDISVQSSNASDTE